MTYVKIDPPRRIDPFIGCFGESRPGASSAPRSTGREAEDPRDPRGDEAA